MLLYLVVSTATMLVITKREGPRVRFTMILLYANLLFSF